MSQNKSKCWYSNNCLQCLKRAVPLVQSKTRVYGEKPLHVRHIVQLMAEPSSEKFYFYGLTGHLSYPCLNSSAIDVLAKTLINKIEKPVYRINR